MDENKICFIICVNDDFWLEECVRYLQWLSVPAEMSVEILEIRNAMSMAAGYNEGMSNSDAKYKVYLHQDVFIKNPFFIRDILQIFQSDEKIGMIGMVGSTKLPANAMMWSRSRVIQHEEQKNWEEYRYHLEDGYWEVKAVDGLLIATQTDIPWREDIFDGWDFYDVSQSMEMARRGFKVVVPKQKNSWYIHDDKEIVQLWNYDKYRQRFLKEYTRELQ